MGSTAYVRLLWLAAILVAALVLVAASASGSRGQAGKAKACTHGLSSIGPVYLRDGKVVGGDTAAHTETCLP
jgi:hypothetical protein